VAVAVGLALVGWSGLAQSAGLGRLTVQSALGQPLQAEVEVTAVGRDEAATLAARLASPDQFRAAGLQYNNSLAGLQMAVEERGGRHVIRVTSRTPVNEPFVDLLVELNWSSGKFVREYTFLLDPPELRGSAARQSADSAAPVVPPTAARVAAPAGAGPAPATSIPAPTQSVPTAPPLLAQQPRSAAPAGAAATGPAAAEGLSPADLAREILAQREREREAAAAKGTAPRARRATSPAASGTEPAAIRSAPADTGTAGAVGSPASTVTVSRGETLGQIAARVKPAAATVEQTIVAIYQANPSAFINGNPNLVREGRTLEIPDSQRIGSVDAATASRQLQLAARDFRVYKDRLAAAPVEVQAAARATGSTASGMVTGRVEDRAATAAPDRLELSKSGQSDSSQGGAVGSRDTEASIARQAALNEANSRVAQLERNVSDLQKMLELKSKSLADLQSQLDQVRASGAAVSGSVAQGGAVKGADAAKGGAAAAKAAEAARAEAAKAEAAAKVESAKAEAAKAGAARTDAAKAEAAKSEAARAEAAKAEAARAEAARAEAAKAAAARVETAKGDAARTDAGKGADPAQGGAAKGADVAALTATPSATGSAGAPVGTPAPPTARAEPANPAPEDGFVDGLLGNPIVLPAIGGLALLGAGWAWFALRRRKSEKFEDSLIAADAFTSNSLFGTTGGQSVDTTTGSAISTQITTMSEASPTEVDPIAEADVYIAYGREAQAEEILKEALKRQPERQAIRLKLLEIYSGRKDVQSFETLAREMYEMTGGHNEEWAKVASMGAALDEANPVYSAAVVGGPASYAESDPDRDHENAAAPLTTVNADTIAGPVTVQDDDRVPATGLATGAFGTDRGPATGAFGTDRGLVTGAFGPERGPDTFTTPIPTFENGRLGPSTVVRRQPVDEPVDLNFEPTGFKPDEAARSRKEFDDALDFASSRTGPPSLLPSVEMPSLDLDTKPGHQPDSDFDVDMPALESLASQSSSRGGMTETRQDLDLSAIGLDLEPTTRSGPATLTGAGSGQWQEMASKLDLASAYGEIGDKEGARELLQEVLRGGDPNQQQRAKDMLARI
jgi:pilus assembly protein FimV